VGIWVSGVGGFGPFGRIALASLLGVCNGGRGQCAQVMSIWKTFLENVYIETSGV
jgi:hypothetical protein